VHLHEPSILTPEQFSFIEAHDEKIMPGWLARKFGFEFEDAAFIDEFIDSEAYRNHFGDRLLDDVIGCYREIVRSTLDLPKPCILTPEQFSFMQAHHEKIMLGKFASKLRGQLAYNFGFEDAFYIDEFIDSEAYRNHFGNMLWDDVIDRYEDTPGYDNSLWIELHEKLQDDIATGQIILA
jgi:hypothetical protein